MAALIAQLPLWCLHCGRQAVVSEAVCIASKVLTALLLLLL
jgi:hypothetical protein